MILVDQVIRFCGREATEEINNLKKEHGEEFYSAAFRNKILLDLVPRMKGFDWPLMIGHGGQSEEAIQRVPQMQMDTFYFPFVEIDEKTKREVMKWAIFEPHGHYI